MLTGSTTAAAGVLHTSQPNVSRSIGQLEKATGLNLFHRSPGKLTPTEEGRLFFNEVQRSYVGLERLDEAAKRVRLFGSGSLRIAAVPTLALGLIPRAIKRFVADHPSVNISIHTGHSMVVTQWVDQQFCDIGVVSQLSAQAYAVDPDMLYEVGGVCLLPKDHRLASKSRIVPTDLEGEAFIALAMHDGLRHSIDRVFEVAGVTRKITLESPYSSVICSLVSLGMGISIVNPIIMRDYRDADIVFRPFEPQIPYRCSMLFPTGRRENRLVDRFAQTLRVLAAEECADVEAMRANV
ncbi:LysR family transcriptional regulator [Bordetella tumulicola]